MYKSNTKRRYLPLFPAAVDAARASAGGVIAEIADRGYGTDITQWPRAEVDKFIIDIVDSYVNKADEIIMSDVPF